MNFEDSLNDPYKTNKRNRRSLHHSLVGRRSISRVSVATKGGRAHGSQINANIEEQKLWYDFMVILTFEPKSYRYHVLLAIIAMLDLISIFMISTDGPQFHENNSSGMYHELPNAKTYTIIRLILNIPLILHSTLVAYSIVSGYLYIGLMDCLKIFSSLIYVIHVFIISDNLWSTYKVTIQSDVLYLFELSKISYILSSLGNAPEFQAIALTIMNSAEAMGVSIVIVIICNIIFGITSHFLEPCYDRSVCQWENMFEASYFSLVTMATIGYGFQVPRYFLTRMLAVVMMSSGGLFLAMPLSIVLKNYQTAYEVCYEYMDELQTSYYASLIRAELLDQDNVTDHSSNVTEETRKNQQRRASLGIMQTNVHTKNLAKKLDLYKRHNRLVHLLSKFYDEVDLLLSPSNEEVDVILERNGAIRVPGPSMKLLSENRVAFLNDNGDNNNDSKSGSNPNGYDKFPNINLNQISQSALPSPDGSIGSDSHGHSSGGFNYISSGQTGRKGYKPILPYGRRRSGSIESVTTLTSQLTDIDYDHPMMQPLHSIPSTSNMSVSVITKMNDTSYEPFSNEKNRVSFAISDDEIGNNVPMDEDYNDNQKDRFADTDSSTMMGYSEVSSGDFQLKQVLRRRNHAISKVKALQTEFCTELHDVLHYIHKLCGLNPINEKFRSIVKKVIKENKANRANQRKGRRAVVLGGETNMKSVSGKGTAKLGAVLNWSTAIDVARKDSLRYQLFLLLELPFYNENSTRIAYILASCSIASVILLFLQSLRAFHPTGESSYYCEKVVEVYCDNKNDPDLDPACFFNSSGINNKLRFFCSDDDCYGHGNNFGSIIGIGGRNHEINDVDNFSGYTCATDHGNGVSPFQTSDTLSSMTIFDTLTNVHQNSPICQRLECSMSSDYAFDGNYIWITLELILFLLFSTELGLRIWIAARHPTFSYKNYFSKLSSLVDLFSVLPIFVELIYAATIGRLDFNVLTSAVTPPIINFFILLKSVRLFKIMRILRSARILVGTIKEGWKRTIVNLGILLMIALPIGFVIYMVERGDPCVITTYDNNDTCLNSVDEEYLPSGPIFPGMLVMVDKLKNSLSQIPNPFYGYWFSVVTVTTTGYGDIYPRSQLGMFVTIFLIVGGSIYLNIPIVVLCDAFTNSYKKTIRDEFKIKAEMRKVVEKSSTDSANMTGRLSSVMRNKSSKDENAFIKFKKTAETVKRGYFSLRELLHDSLTDVWKNYEERLEVEGTDVYMNSLHSETEEMLQTALQSCIRYGASIFDSVNLLSKDLENI